MTEPTQRQRTILLYVAGGHTNQYIANRLGLAKQSVKNELRKLYARIGARNRAHAVAIALAHEWIRYEP